MDMKVHSKYLSKIVLNILLKTFRSNPEVIENSNICPPGNFQGTHPCYFQDLEISRWVSCLNPWKLPGPENIQGLGISRLCKALCWVKIVLRLMVWSVYLCHLFISFLGCIVRSQTNKLVWNSAHPLTNQCTRAPRCPCLISIKRTWYRKYSHFTLTHISIK